MSYTRPIITSKGVFSSNGTFTTTSNNQTWSVPNSNTGVSLAIEFVTAGGMQFGDETGYAQFEAGTRINFDQIAFRSLRFETTGTSVKFYGVYA